MKVNKVEAWDIAAHNHGQIKPMTKSSKCTRKKKRPMVKLMKQRRKNGDATVWAIETPMDIRDAAAMDLMKSFRSNLSKRKQNPNYVWDYKFHSKRGREQTIKILGKCVKTRGCPLPIVHQQGASSLVRGGGGDRERAADSPGQNSDFLGHHLAQDGAARVR